MGGSRVLVVEDEGLIAMALGDDLAHLGHQVIGPFAHLAPAVLAARSESIDFALLDINLNGQPVYPVADELLARRIPFAFLTGVDIENLPLPYQRQLSLSKPYSSINIEQVIDTLLSKA